MSKPRANKNIPLMLSEVEFNALTENGTRQLSKIVAHVLGQRENELETLALSHPQNGQQRMCSVPVDMAEAVREAAHGRFTTLTILTYSMMRPAIDAALSRSPEFKRPTPDHALSRFQGGQQVAAA